MLNLPNVLSVGRLLLVPVFAWIYCAATELSGCLLAAGVLLLSGVTDMLDGFLARRLNQITTLGKLLDPFADKLTQLTVCICLSVRRPEFTWLLGLFILKEIIMLAAGVGILYKRWKIESSRWFGKLYTFAFYAGMLLIIGLEPLLPTPAVWGILAVLGALMLLAFAMYASLFVRISRENRKLPSAALSAKNEEKRRMLGENQKIFTERRK